MMLKMFIHLSDGSDQPSLCDPLTWAVYQIWYRVRFRSSLKVQEMASYGFRTRLNSVANLWWKTLLSAGTMFFLNLRYLNLWTDSGTNFFVTKSRQADDMII